MIRFLVLVAVLFGLAFGFHRLKGTQGEVALTIGDTAYAVDLVTAVLALAALVIVAVAIVWFLAEIGRAPGRFRYGWRRRNAQRAQQAVANGLIALASGDIRAAERASDEARRRAPAAPLSLLLAAQTAQLRGDHKAARLTFQEMTETHETRVAGLRGLHMEAERDGADEAAHHIALIASAESASAPWAARALLRRQIAAGDWDGALKTLSAAADGRSADKRIARRQRAVVLTAKALAGEVGDPDAARAAAIEAHELAPSLVPAAVVAGRLLARNGDIRRATRVLESAWKAAPHPELADAYARVRAGDSAADRLKRAEALRRLRPEADEGRLALARAAVEARDFARARDALSPILTTRPTRNALLAMAELQEAETGDRGRAREWVARAVRAPLDPAWTADGVVLEHWSPVSPVTGRIDAVQWKVPFAEPDAPVLAIEAADLAPVVAVASALPYRGMDIAEIAELPAPAALPPRAATGRDAVERDAPTSPAKLADPSPTAAPAASLGRGSLSDRSGGLSLPGGDAASMRAMARDTDHRVVTRLERSPAIPAATPPVTLARNDARGDADEPGLPPLPDDPGVEPDPADTPEERLRAS